MTRGPRTTSRVERAAGVQQLAHRVGMGDRQQRPVGAVDRLGPGVDRAARGHLEHVGRKPPVGHAEVHRRRVGVAVELEVGDLGHAGALGNRLGDRALDERLVTHRLFVGVRAGHDLIVEGMGTLGTLLDRASIQPEPRLRSVQNSRIWTVSRNSPVRLTWLPGAVLDVVADRGLDPDDDPVAGAAAVDQPDVVDVRVAQRLDPVAPAPAVEVVQAPLPLGQQVGCDQSRERRAVVGIPGGLDVHEQPRGRRLDDVGRERRVLLGGLGRGELHTPLAVSRAVALGAALVAAGDSNALARPVPRVITNQITNRPIRTSAPIP